MKFNLTAHKELWNWLADNPSCNKEEWPGWKHNGGQYPSDCSMCFACQYDERFHDGPCAHCPLKWNSFNCEEPDAIYKKWKNETIDLIYRSDLARQIANLPVREGVEHE